MGIKSFGNNAEDFVSKFLRARSFDSTGLDAANPEPPPPFTATGGTILTPGNGYKYHIFTSSSTPGFEVSVENDATLVDYLLVGGGGSGGENGSTSASGAGGGAGGYLEFTSTIFSIGSYPVVIGNGGAAPPGSGGSGPYPSGNPGGQTEFNGKTAYGGGGGNGYAPPSPNSGSGGSGAGAGNDTGEKIGGYGLNPSTPAPIIALFPQYEPGTIQGYPGGTTPPVGARQAWSGGGAGAAATGAKGANGRAVFSGDTGIPASYGTSGPTAGRWFGGGGGAGFYTTSGPAPDGGGGGAGGGPAVPDISRNGLDNTGGGGGGGWASGNNAVGNGGSGIVIIRYPK